MPITRMMIESDRPSRDARTMASASQGSTRNQSVMRMSPVSSQPP
jgi:hypothetical protein